MNRLNSLALIVIACAVSVAVSAQSLKVKDVIYPMETGSVRLTNQLESDIQNSLVHWNKGVVPYKKLVDFMRYGRPQFALGEMWGKAVRSGSMFYRYTHDKELKNILKATVVDMLSAQRSNGSFCCVPPKSQPDGPGGDLWERKYVLLGFEDYYENVDKDPKVLKAMKEHADCIIAQIGDAPKAAITELGWSPNHIESSTLLEPIMRLYKLTVDNAYLRFAKYIVDSGGAKGYNLFQQAIDNVMGGVYPKAYEMLSLFEGLVEYYRATGDQRWKTAFMNLYQNVKSDEITIIGNGGGDQPYHPAVCGEAWDNTAKEQTNPTIKRMMETCTGVTWMKYCSQILRVTGDAGMVDYIEKYIYNGLLGAMKPTGDGFSYVNLLNGMKVTNQGWGTDIDGLPVTCCNLNGPMGLAYIPYLAVMKSDKGPVINLFNACTVNNRTPKGQPLQMSIKGNFPHNNMVNISVNPMKAEKFTVSVRIPGWSNYSQVSVNGKMIKNVVPGEYLQLARIWKKGDVIRVKLDMTAHLIKAPKGSNRAGDGYCAVQYGPIVLARDENTDNNYNKPVSIIADEKGIVNIIPKKSTLSTTRLEFEVPTSDGPIRMIDYASVNGWNGKKVCTWLPVK